MTGGRPFRVRWLGRVRYRDALALQQGIFAEGKQHAMAVGIMKMSSVQMCAARPPEPLRTDPRRW